MASRRPPPRIDPAPDPVDPALAPLLGEPFASAWSDGPDASRASGPLRTRLLGRLAASKAASAAMVTRRFARLRPEPAGEGVSVRTLYAAEPGRAPRPGEPQRAALVELAPGARWTAPDAGVRREWLELRGSVRIGTEPMTVRDYLNVPAGHPPQAVRSDDGALLFLRASQVPGDAGGAACCVRDAEVDWPEYAPGIRRRVLWRHGAQAALLYHAAAGASVPVHRHGHDEECLMVQGELFLDDVLLQPGDYQLAPAGTGHRVTETDTGVVLYAHGDLDLDFVDG